MEYAGPKSSSTNIRTLAFGTVLANAGSLSSCPIHIAEDAQQT